MDLVRLVYHSRNRLDPNRPAADQVAEILAVSIACNERDDITGGLICDPRWFIQVLEGPAQAVTQTFERILRDARHKDVALVVMQPIAERRYGLSRMAHAAHNPDNMAIFSHFSDGKSFDPMLISTERLLDLADAVLHHRPGRQPSLPWMTRGANTAA